MAVPIYDVDGPDQELGTLRNHTLDVNTLRATDFEDLEIPKIATSLYCRLRLAAECARPFAKSPLLTSSSPNKYTKLGRSRVPVAAKARDAEQRAQKVLHGFRRNCPAAVTACVGHAPNKL